MLHQVDFFESGALIVPVCKGAHRDLLFEQSARLRPAMTTSGGTVFSASKPIHGGGANYLESCEAGATDAQVSVSAQVIRLNVHRRAQTLGADLIKEFREPETGAFVLRELNPPAHALDGRLWVAIPAFPAQQGGCMFAMIARGGDELVEYLTALFLPCLAITFA